MSVLLLHLLATSLNAYYYESVNWAANNGIVTGLGNTGTFGPDNICSRSHIMTFLWRTEKSPIISDEKNPFPDINRDDYFYHSVLWANDKKITTGYGDTNKFMPYEPCSRAQILTFLWR